MPDTVQAPAASADLHSTTQKKPASAVLADCARYLEWLAYHGPQPADLELLRALDERRQARQDDYAVTESLVEQCCSAPDARSFLAAYDRLTDHLWAAT